MKRFVGVGVLGGRAVVAVGIRVSLFGFWGCASGNRLELLLCRLVRLLISLVNLQSWYN